MRFSLPGGIQHSRSYWSVFGEIQQTSVIILKMFDVLYNAVCSAQLNSSVNIRFSPFFYVWYVYSRFLCRNSLFRCFECCSVWFNIFGPIETCSGEIQFPRSVIVMLFLHSLVWSVQLNCCDIHFSDMNIICAILSVFGVSKFARDNSICFVLFNFRLNANAGRSPIETHSAKSNILGLTGIIQSVRCNQIKLNHFRSYFSVVGNTEICAEKTQFFVVLCISVFRFDLVLSVPLNLCLDSRWNLIISAVKYDSICSVQFNCSALFVFSAWKKLYSNLVCSVSRSSL